MSTQALCNFFPGAQGGRGAIGRVLARSKRPVENPAISSGVDHVIARHTPTTRFKSLPWLSHRNPENSAHNQTLKYLGLQHCKQAYISLLHNLQIEACMDRVKTIVKQLFWTVATPFNKLDNRTVATKAQGLAIPFRIPPNEFEKTFRKLFHFNIYGSFSQLLPPLMQCA
jgi:hypothetical protein